MANIKINKSCRAHFALALTVSETFSILNIWPWKVSQGHGVQLSQWCHSIANTKIYKSSSMHFCTRALTISNILVFEIFDRSKSWSTTFTKIYKSCSMHFLHQLSPLPWYYHLNYFTLKKYFKVTEYNIRNTSIRWQILKSIKIMFFKFLGEMQCIAFRRMLS